MIIDYTNEDLVLAALATVALPNPNPILNSGTISYSYTVDPLLPLGQTSSTNTNIVSTQVNNATLSSTKSVVPANSFVGYTLTYTIVLKNTGNVTANNVVFIDTTPNGTSFIDNTLSFNGVVQTLANPNPPNGAALPNIAPSQTLTITFQTTVTTIPTVNPIPNNSTTNFNYLLNPSTGQTIPSGVISNTATSFVNPFTNPVKLVNVQQATIGETLVYTIAWQNRLSDSTFNTVLIDTTPNGVSFIPNSVTVNGVTVPGATLAPPTGLNLATVPAGAIVTVTFNVVVNTIPSPNPIPNSTTVGYNFVLDPTLGIIDYQTAVSNTANTQINFADIGTVTKSVNASYGQIGDKLTYTLVFKNNGNTTAISVAILDTVPANTVFIQDSIYVNGNNRPGETTESLTVGTVSAQQTVTVTFDVTISGIPNPNTIPNNASLTYNYYSDPLQQIEQSGGANTNTVSTAVNQAILSSQKQVNRIFGKVGDIITYTIPITNTGNVTALNVIFSDTIPSDTTIVPGSFTQDGSSLGGSPNPPGVTLGSIKVGQTTTLVFKVTVNTIPSPNPVVNAATTVFTYTIDPVSIPNRTGSSSTNTNTVSTQINSVNLSNAVKYVDKVYGGCGDTLVYTIVIPNTGNTTAINVVFKDTIPNGTALDSTSVYVNGQNRTGGDLTTGITLPDISPLTTTTVTFNVIVSC